MVTNALAAFVGCFSALLVFAELGGISNKFVRYLAAFVVGILVAIVLGIFLAWVSRMMGHAG